MTSNCCNKRQFTYLFYFSVLTCICQFLRQKTNLNFQHKMFPLNIDSEIRVLA